MNAAQRQLLETARKNERAIIAAADFDMASSVQSQTGIFAICLSGEHLLSSETYMSQRREETQGTDWLREEQIILDDLEDGDEWAWTTTSRREAQIALLIIRHRMPDYAHQVGVLKIG